MPIVKILDVFAKLPAILQCTLLLQTANGMKDVIQQARLMTFVLSRYPDTVARQGVKNRLCPALLNVFVVMYIKVNYACYIFLFK